MNGERIAREEAVRHGFENLPKALLRLYRAANWGKQLLEV
jgi:NADPH-dependent curcumin reductase CurA